MKKTICSLISAMVGLCASGDVWTDCTAWFVGADDKNSSGYYDSGELFDIRHAGDTSQSGTRECNRENIRILTEDVQCPILGRTLTNQKVLYFDGSYTVTNNPSGATEKDMDIRVNGNCIKFADPITNDTYTVLIRFKPDEHHPWTGSYQHLIDLGMSGEKGTAISLHDDPAQNRVLACYGKNYFIDLGSYTINLTNSVFKARSDVWHDLALVVSRPSDTKVRFRMGHAVPGTSECDNKVDTKMQWVQKDVSTNANFTTSRPSAGATRLGGEGGDSSVYGKTNYRGKIHMLAMWNRALSDREVFEAFGSPTPSLFRIGVAGAEGTDLFKGASSADVTVSSLPEKWREAPAKLEKGRKVTVGFDISKCQTNANQILRFTASEGSGTISVAIDGTLVRECVPVAAGRTACVNIHRRHLRSPGAHTCTVTRTDSQDGDLVPAFIDLSGSWQLTAHDKSWSGMNSAGATWEDFYVTDGNVWHMRRIVMPPNDISVNVHFDVPEDFVGHPANLLWATCSAQGNGHSTGIQLNGNQIYEDSVADGVVHALKLPAGSLVAGDNVLRFSDPSSASSYVGFDFIRFEIDPQSGAVIIVR